MKVARRATRSYPILVDSREGRTRCTRAGTVVSQIQFSLSTGVTFIAGKVWLACVLVRINHVFSRGVTRYVSRRARGSVVVPPRLIRSSTT